MASDDPSATVALLGEMDGDLDFFHELFEDFPTNDGVGQNAAASPPPSCLTVAASSNRRRQRWLTCDGGRDLPTLCGWRDVAKTQKHARQAAEDENARLRRLVMGHERAVQKMMKLMQKAATTLSSREIVTQPMMALNVPFMGPPVDLVQICGLQNRIVSTSMGDALESTVEMTWLLPFDVDAITRAMVAHSIRLVTRKQVHHCTTIYESPDLKILQAVSKTKEKNGVRITKHGQLATRRDPLRRDGSQLVLMESQVSFYMDQTCVVSISGDSCIHVSPVPGHDDAAHGPLSRITWARRFCAQPFASATMTSADCARWINMFTAESTRKTKRQVDKLTQAFENILLAPN